MTDYFVIPDHPSASNGNLGTNLSQPWRTLAYAVGASSPVGPGDTIYCDFISSDYTESVTLGKSGTSGSRITLRSLDPFRPITLRLNSGTSFVNKQAYWNIEYIIIIGATSSETDGMVLGDGTTRANYITYRFCVIKHCTNHGIAARNTGNLVMEDCWIYDNRTRIAANGCQGIYVQTAMVDARFTRCVFFDNGADGIQWQTTTASALFEDCIFSIKRPNGSRTWHWGAVNNTGENGIDTKRVGGIIRIKRCLFTGFYQSVAGQDIGGTSNGSAIVVHVDSNSVYIEDVVIADCGQGISTSQGGGTGSNTDVRLSNVMIRDLSKANSGTAIGLLLTFLSGVRAHHVTIYGVQDVYLQLGQTLTLDQMMNCLITGGSGAAKGSYDRNTPISGETGIQYNGWHNLASGPPAQWNNNPIAITTLGLDAHLAPTVSSSAYQAGINLGYARDLAGNIRPVNPSLGALEPTPALPSNANLLYFDGRTLYLPGYFDEIADNDGELALHPIAAIPNTFGLAVKVADTDAHSVRKVFSATSTLRFAFYIRLQWFQMTSGNSFSIITIRDNSNRLGDVILRYDSGTFYIGAGTLNDAGTQQWAGSSSGFVIDRSDHLIEVQVVAATAPGANNGSIRLWIDGILQGSNTTIDSDTRSFTRLHIGAPADIDAGTGSQEEELGTFFLYGIRANNNGQEIGPLSGALPDLPTVYDNDSRVKAYWQYTEASGVTRQDLTANNNDLTDATGVARVAEGVDGWSADFERDDNDQLSITHAAQTGLAITNNKVTLIARFKPETVDIFQYLIAKWGASTNRMQYALSINASNQLQMRISTNGSASVEAQSEATLAAATWAWLGGTYGGTTLLSYVNGARSGLPVLQSGNLYNGNADVVIGGHSDGGSRLDGLKDYGIIAAGEFSGAEMESIYLNGLVASGSPGGGGILYPLISMDGLGSFFRGMP